MLQQSPSRPPRRFIAAKVWLVRLGIMALVGAGVGIVAGVAFQSWPAAGVGFLLGAAAVARRAMRIGSADIDF